MTKPKPASRGRPRKPAILTVVKGAHPGTAELIEALVRESIYGPHWRPIRSAAVMAMAVSAAGDHVWMTTAEFDAWKAMHFPDRRRGATSGLMRVLDMGKGRLASIRAGSPVKKWEALACAHYALGLPLPIESGNPEVFARWIVETFGATVSIAGAAGLAKDRIADRMSGRELCRGVSVKREPEEAMIRALDWIRRVGPFSPYGQRAQAEAFPGQRVRGF